VSLIFSESLGKASGGLVVPGYMALQLTQPVSVIATLAAALLTFGVVRVLSSQLIIYGKRRTVLTLLCGFIVGAAIRTCGGLMPPAAEGFELTVIGYIVPGLIAIWIDRQGWLDTCAATLTAAAVVRLSLVLLVPQQLHWAELQRPKPERPAVERAAETPHAFTTAVSNMANPKSDQPIPANGVPHSAAFVPLPGR
jgi:poly-gamma-glutamate biosynthesis protein PgsC/CapC